LAACFFDRSALVKLYVNEAGSALLIRLVGRAEPMALVTLTQIELRSAIRKRQRAKDISLGEAEEAIRLFETDYEKIFSPLPITQAVIELAKTLVDRHGLRTYDAVQLAGCLFLKRTAAGSALTFVCSDRDLLQAAAAEALDVWNPDVESPHG
jgi:predicted nucleic acid-binding protein